MPSGERFTKPPEMRMVQMSTPGNGKKEKETGEHGNEDYYGKASTRFTVLHRFGKWPFTSREEKRRTTDPV